MAGSDVLHLVAVPDEGVADELVALRAGGEVDADLAALEPVVAEPILVGVVDEDALLGADAIGGHAGRRFIPGRQPVLACLASAHARSGPALRRLRPADHRVSGDLRAVCKVEQEAAVA